VTKQQIFAPVGVKKVLKLKRKEKKRKRANPRRRKSTRK
jgi:hypothetical protein